jgi:hypothetical protein
MDLKSVTIRHGFLGERGFFTGTGEAMRTGRTAKQIASELGQRAR